MLALPVLLVFRDGAPKALLEALERVQIPCREASLPDAAESINSGWARVLVCERLPGWQALMGRVEVAGGASVLFGPRLAPHEAHVALPEHLESVQDPDELPEALLRAEASLHNPDKEEIDTKEAALLERARTAEWVSRFSRSIASQLDLPALSAETTARCRDLCHADGAQLFLVDPATGTLTSSSGQDEVHAVASQVAKQGDALRLTSDNLQLARLRGYGDATMGFQAGSLVAVPLLHDGDVVGVMEAVRGKGRPFFQERHLRRLQALAPHVALALHHLRMTAALKETQSAVLRANTELEEKVRQRTQQITQGKKEWEQTFDAIRDPLALQDGFIVRRANLAYARRAGVDITQLPGKPCHVLLAGRETPCPGCPLAANALSGEVALPPESIFAFQGFRFSDAVGSTQVVVHYRDITAEKGLERKLRESERLVALGQLASGAAHEINNPMGFVISNLHSLESTLQDLNDGSAPLGGDEAKELLTDGLQMVSESLVGAGRVKQIVQGLRELSRLQVDRPEPSHLEGSLTRALRAEFGKEATERVVLDLRAAAQAHVSPLHLDQAFGHVLRNARQALSAGQKVFVRSWDEAHFVVVEIEDQGCGISEENVTRVFEPFFTTRGVGGGIGLGLTAVYGIVQRYQGNIEVNSTLGKGTTVRIHLPRAVSPPNARAAHQEAPSLDA